jgi:hypothetical protein
MSNNKEEVGLKDIITRIQSFCRFLLSKWIILSVVIVIGALLGLLYAFAAKPKYSATLNFVLSNNSSSQGNLLGLASQFGIDLGSSSNNVFSGDNIITLMKSRRMVQQALFGKPDESNVSLLNLFIKNYELNIAWNNLPRTKGAYPFPDKPEMLTQIQDSLLRIVYNAIQDNFLDVSKPDKNQDVYTVTTTSNNAIFSYYLTKYLVDATSAFYISTKTSTAQQSLNMLQHEADSLRNMLGATITSAGSQTDYTFNLNPAYQVQRSGVQQSQARAAALGQAYGQVLQNLEIAKINLQKETPLYQIIDAPTLPLVANKPGKLTSLILGGFIAGFLMVLIFAIYRLYIIYFKS